MKLHPVLAARPGGILRPHWKIPQGDPPASRIRVHRGGPAVALQSFNDPLAVGRGELCRFDIVDRDGGRMDVVFTWAHALMDAPAAEHFLAVVGHADMELPAPNTAPTPSTQTRRERVKIARKNLALIHEFAKAPPRTIPERFSDAPPNLHYRIEKFSVAETSRVHAHGERLCGFLGAAQYHAAAAAVELHELYQRLGSHTPSYIIPVPAGLRPKGTVEPLFSNQMAMLMLQFLPEQLDSVANAVAALKTQTTRALREGLIESGLVCAELVRFLPLPLFMALLKHGLRGEICSLFYGNIAAVSPLLDNFMGVPMKDVLHIAAVTPTPGLGTIFHQYRGMMRLTVVHSPRILTDAEAADFAARLRSRLLNP
jgi:hypothetical protein